MNVCGLECGVKLVGYGSLQFVIAEFKSHRVRNAQSIRILAASLKMVQSLYLMRGILH